MGSAAALLALGGVQLGESLPTWRGEREELKQGLGKETSFAQGTLGFKQWKFTPAYVHALLCGWDPQ